MTVTCSIYKAEKQRVAVDEWAARDLRCLLLDTTSTYVFNETDLYVADVLAGGGVEGAWTSYARQALTLSAPTYSGGYWQLLVSTTDFGIIGSSGTHKTAGVIVYQHVTTDADHLLVAHAAVSPTVAVYDGSNPFTVTWPGTGLAKVGG